MPNREKARQRLGLPPDAPLILCVSRFTGRNEPKTDSVIALLATLAQLPREVLLVLVGDGPGRPQVEQETERRQVNGRVWLTGAVQDLEWCYAACDVFAFPDFDDRPRLAVLEAQACGRPVVTMSTDSAKLIVDADRTGFLAKDLEDFQSQLAALISDPPRCDAMGRAAREYIATHHSMDVRARQIEELLVAP